MTASYSARALALLESFEDDEAEPKFEPLAFSRNDCPAIDRVWPTPGMPGDFSPSFDSPDLESPSAIRLIFSMTSCVRCTDAESGSCTLTSR